MKRRLTAAALAALLLALAAAYGVAHRHDARIAASVFQADPNLTLVDAAGRTIRAGSLSGQWTLFFFGYTHCPDFCPTALMSVGTALDALGPLADRLHPVFMTLDPARDTPVVLGDYLKNFDSRIVGLSGSEARIAEAAKAFNVFYARRDTDDGNDYGLDHTAVFILTDPAGRMVRAFSYDVTPAALAQELRPYLAVAGARP